LRLFSFGGYGLALAALALVVFGAIECPPTDTTYFSAADCREVSSINFDDSKVEFDYEVAIHPPAP